MTRGSERRLRAATREQWRAWLEKHHPTSKGPMTLEVRAGMPVPQACAVHFAVPAARWWDDIVYT